MNPEERACMRRSGPDCRYLTTAFSYWCTNKACCRSRGTSIPGGVGCPYYRPEREVPWSEFWGSMALLLCFNIYLWITVTLAWSLL